MERLLILYLLTYKLGMGKKTLTKLSILGISFTLALVLVLAPSLVDATHVSSHNKAPGAIFTTTPDGGIVNENVHYAEKIEVYLDGGPPPNAPAKSAGLPAGDYVFQITDPSGKTLLSDDPSKCRVIEVSSDGVIIGRVSPDALTDLGGTPLGLLTTWDGGIECHIDDAPTPDDPAGPDDAGASGQHDTNVDVDHGVGSSDPKDAIVVQMMPFFDTPNNGGVYKAWITPYSTYIGEGLTCDGLKGRQHRDCLNAPEFDRIVDLFDHEQDELKFKGKQIGWLPDRSFGPSNHESKTDNFKVFIERPTPPEEFPMIHVLKYHDINADGMRDFTNEPSIGPTVEEFDELDPFDNNICVDENGVIGTGACPPASGEGGFIIVLTDPPGDGNNAINEGTPVWVIAAEEGDWTILEQLYPNWIVSSAFVGDTPDGGTDQGATTSVMVNVPAASLDPDAIFITFGNFLPGAVTGFKYEDDNADGVFDDQTEGHWAHGDVTITITCIGGSCDDTTPFTDTTTVNPADGTFGFTGLIPGIYEVSESFDDPEIQSNDDTPIQFTLESGETIDLTVDGVNNQDFGNFLPGDVTGFKYEDKNADGVFDDQTESHWAHGDVTITITCIGGECDDTTPFTDTTTVNPADGTFGFTGLIPGIYEVSESFDDPEIQSNDDTPIQFTLESGESIDLTVDGVNNQDFGNYFPASVHGFKFEDRNASGDRQETEPGIEGVKITIEQFNDQWQVIFSSMTFTESDGRFWFMDLNPGVFKLTETPPDGTIPTTPVMTDPFTLMSGQEKEFGYVFGNFVGPCNGLTPGYWKNWDNHYSMPQFNQLLPVVIDYMGNDVVIAQNKQAVDTIFDEYNASDPQDLTILKAFVLANMLTLHLSQTDLPNPSDGNLVLICTLDGQPLAGNLGDALELAAGIIGGFVQATDQEIIDLKNILDDFANQQFP